MEEKTKFGKFLSKVKDILPEAGNVGVSIISGNYVGAVKELGQILSKNKDKNEDIKQLDLEFQILKHDFEMEMAKIESENISNRWNADMVSDSWLSKNVRPMTLIYLMLLLTLALMLDVFELGIVKDSWISLLEYLVMTVIIAYFGSRGVEKYKKIK